MEQTVVSPLILVSGAGMLLVSIAFIIYALRRGATWGYMGLGALVWIVTVAIKFAIAIPLNPLVYNALYDPTSLWAPGSLLLYVYIGSLTGLTEVLLAWLLLRYTRLGRVAWNKVLAFGIGFGAFEALLLGLSSLASSLAVLFVPGSIPAEAMGAYVLASNPLYGLGPVVERFSAILVHLVCNALLFYGVATKQPRWFWISFAFKSLLDTVAAFAQFWGVETIAKLWTIEAIILVLGLISWWGAAKIRQAYPAVEAAAP
jgi:uncharacterized membrane protein YhfC